MYRLARPTVNALKAPTNQRKFAKATLLGRLGAAPEVRTSSQGKPYVTYNLAVNKPPKRDDKGQIVTGEDGYPVRDTNWFTVFNFRPGAEQFLPALEPGTQLLVEATLETRPGQQGGSEMLLRELSHKVVSRKQQK